jgi:hypothetical protein
MGSISELVGELKDYRCSVRCWKPLPENWLKHGRLRNISVCSSELQSVIICNNAIFTCS